MDQEVQRHALFDKGWNALREQIFANQKKLGVIPPGREADALAERSARRWDTLDADEKKLFIRQADVYAAYLAYTDHEIGRVIQAVEDMGKLDNTLIIYISGDNGASAEGTLERHAERGRAVQRRRRSRSSDQLKNFYDVWGSDQTYPHMAVAWAWAFDTPFKWTKQVASHFGGTRQGMAMAWPKRIKDAGGIRTQFHHVIDIVPTILEATGIPAPVMVNGIAQKPIEGVSMAYTWDKANADAPSKRKTQYFEMFGNRAIYHDGWIAATTPVTAAVGPGGAPCPGRDRTATSGSSTTSRKDWTQDNDLAAKMPDKLQARCRSCFYVEADEVPGASARQFDADAHADAAAERRRRAGTCSPIPASDAAFRTAPRRASCSGPTRSPPRSRFPKAAPRA